MITPKTGESNILINPKADETAGGDVWIIPETDEKRDNGYGYEWARGFFRRIHAAQMLTVVEHDFDEIETAAIFTMTRMICLISRS